MNNGYVLSEPESTKGRGMGMCFIESSSLYLHFGKAKTSLVLSAQTSLHSNFTFAGAKTSLAKRRASQGNGYNKSPPTRVILSGAQAESNRGAVRGVTEQDLGNR